MSDQSDLQKALIELVGGKKTYVAEVVREGLKVSVPEGMPIEGAIEVLQAQLKAEEEVSTFSTTLSVFPWEGALALYNALESITGYAQMIKTPGFFSDTPPSWITVQTSDTDSVQVPWGRIKFTHDGGFFQTNTTWENGVIVFKVDAKFKKKHEPVYQKVIAEAKRLVKADSIYRGSAIALKFYDQDGQKLGIPELSFYPVVSDDVKSLTFTRDIEDLIGASVMAPLEHFGACKAAGIPFKRGVLFAGQWGTGKTLLARKIAQVATENAVTFFYVRNVSELADAIPMARQYQPAVIFAEDIDRATAGQARTESIDKILNTMDGIDSKNTDIMVILTTNHLDQINQAMLRPGRIDALIHITPPDAEAAARLVRKYGRDLVGDDQELALVGEALAGKIPAVIREVTERSKLAHIYRTGSAPAKGSISAADLLVAAKSMDNQIAALAVKEIREPSNEERAAAVTAGAMVRIWGSNGATPPAVIPVA